MRQIEFTAMVDDDIDPAFHDVPGDKLDELAAVGTVLHLGEILKALDVEPYKKFRFKIEVEEVGDED